MEHKQREFIKVSLTKSELDKIIYALDFAEAGEAIDKDTGLLNYLNSLCSEE